MKLRKYKNITYLCLHFARQDGQDGKNGKENQATKVTKIWDELNINEWKRNCRKKIFYCFFRKTYANIRSKDTQDQH